MSKVKSPIRRSDSNQAEIVEWLRQDGYSVWDTHVLGCGFPDLVVAKDEKNLLVEIKGSRFSALTDNERDFFFTWRGAKIVATCADDVINWFSEHA